MTTPYLITAVIPEDHDWDSDTVALAEQLLRAVSGEYDDRDERAALALLFRGPVEIWTGPDFLRHAKVYGTDQYLVDWHGVHASANSGVLSAMTQHRALLLIACSIASSPCPVRLRPRLAELTPQLRDAVVGAIAYVAGW